MALRNQPYIPLYVQDYLTDEKLNECSASTQGIYIKLMCIMHKSDEYGTILLKQKDKQNSKQIHNFAYKLVKHLPFTEVEITLALKELISEGVLCLVKDKIVQKRMVKDNELSIKRAEAGKKGGESTQVAKAKPKAKVKPNTEYEIETEDETITDTKIEIIYPFTSEKFLKMWNLWKKYRAERKLQAYKPIGEQAALKKLSNYDEDTACKMIMNSIENNYQGIFELKNNINGKHSKIDYGKLLSDLQEQPSEEG